MRGRHLVSGVLVVSAVLLHSLVFDWESRSISGHSFEAAPVMAFGVWPADGVAGPTAFVVGVAIPGLLIGLTAYLSRRLLAGVFKRIAPLAYAGPADEVPRRSQRRGPGASVPDQPGAEYRPLGRQRPLLHKD